MMNNPESATLSVRARERQEGARLQPNNRILIVDDNEAIHADFRKILSGDAAEASFDAEEAAVFGPSERSVRRVCFEMDFALQGQQALELVRAATASGKPYAVAFVDMRMPPGWDGLHTTQKLWEVDPDLQIVICTAYSDYSWEEMIGAIASPERLLILKKPFDTIEVLQFAHALTEKWALLQAARSNTAELERLVQNRTSELSDANVRLAGEVTDRKCAEERALQSLGEQRALADALVTERSRLVAAQIVAKVGDWEVNFATTERSWSAEMYRILEAPVEDPQQLRAWFQQIVHPDDRTAVNAMEEASLTRALPSVQQHRLLMPDGRVKFLEQRWQVFHDGTGKPIRATGTVQDITQRAEAQATLQREREFLSALIENVSDGIVSCDAAGTLTLFNSATREFHGLPSAPIPPESWAEHFSIYQPDGKTLMSKEEIPLFRALQNGSVKDAEMVIAPRNGPARRILASGRSFTNQRGDTIGAVVVMHDVTEAKEAAEKLSRSHQLMEAVTEGTTDAVFAKGADGRYLMINTVGAAFLGKTPAEVIGHTDAEFFEGETLERVCNRDREIMRTGEFRTHENASTAGDITRTYMTLKGPLRDAAGQVAGVVGYSRDISERKRAEEALRQSESELRTLIESMPQIVWITGPDGRHLQFNQRWMDYTGLTIEESVGDGWNPLFHPDDRAEAIRRWQDALETGDAYDIEYRLRRADGRFRWMLGRALPLRDANGTITKWLGTCTDIEELKNAAEVARNNEREQRALAAQLAAERARLVAAQSVAQVGDWDLDIVTQERSWSAETFRIYETEENQSDQLHERFLELVHPEDRAGVEAVCEAALTRQAPNVHQHRLLMPDGRIKCVEQHWQVFHDEAGRPIRAAGTIQDITERAEAQEVLRRSEMNLALAQSVSHTGSWEIDFDSAEGEGERDLNWSDEEFRIFGLEPGAVHATERTFYNLVHVDDREPARAAFAAALKSADGSRYDFEHRITWPDGAEREVHEQAVFLRDEESGVVTKVIGTTRDVTARNQDLRTLREQAEMLNLAQDAIVVRGCEDRVITFWNKGAEHLYGWTAREAIGRRMDELLYTDREHFEEVAHTVASTGEFRGEVHQVAKDGRKLITNARANVVQRAGERPCVLVIHTDVTEHKKLESQFLRAQRLESIGTLASGVAHDLNNVLAPILMSAPLLRDEIPPRLREKIIDTIEQSAERGAQIVRQVLTFARGVEGERVLLDPRHLIKEMAEIAQQTFPKNIQVLTRYTDDLALLEGDPTQLHQVLLNLAVNARDAMPDGGKLVLAAENFDVDAHYAAMTPGVAPGRYVLINVSDSGTGIAPDVMEKMFDPFFTTKKLGEGTGLGLSTLLGIVQTHAGIVNAYSTPAGTTFRVLLPAADADKLDAAGAEAEVPRGRGECILVVDDEAAIRQVAQVVLERSGYEVAVADDGPAALALFAQRQGEFALVLTDFLMPTMNGLALARIIRKMNAAAKLVISTGREDDCSETELDAIGIAAALTKPYTQATLLRTIDRVLHVGSQAEKSHD
jgi:PAS domain S-box-containing protein